MNIGKKGEMEPSGNLFEKEEAIIAGDNILLQFEYKGKVFHQHQVYFYTILSSRWGILLNGLNTKPLNS